MGTAEANAAVAIVGFNIVGNKAPFEDAAAVLGVRLVAGNIMAASPSESAMAFRFKLNLFILTLELKLISNCSRLNCIMF